MKPIGKSQGKGIFIFSKINMIADWKHDYRWKPDGQQAEPYIVQKYLENPLLIGGKKFDMRIYCLCKSYNPLTLYLYRSGFCRFTHTRYTSGDIGNLDKHLTNVAIQKLCSNYDSKIGGKWMLRKLKIFLSSRYGKEKVNQCFKSIQSLIIESLLAVQPVIINDKQCFETYGFDIMLDSNLKPWLIEVNASPSFTANTNTDYILKMGLVDDVLNVLDKERVLTGDEEQIGGFDLIYKNAPYILPPSSVYQSFLGALNNRKEQMKRLSKATALRLAQEYQERRKHHKKYNNNASMGHNSHVKGGRSRFGMGRSQRRDQNSNNNTTSHQQAVPIIKSINPKIPRGKINKKSKLRRNYYKRPKLPKPVIKEEDAKNGNLLQKPMPPQGQKYSPKYRRRRGKHRGRSYSPNGGNESVRIKGDDDLTQDEDEVINRALREDE